MSCNALDITEVLIFYADSCGDGQFQNFYGYLILRFYSNLESRKNLMLAKYTCFRVSYYK